MPPGASPRTDVCPHHSPQQGNEKATSLKRRSTCTRDAQESRDFCDSCQEQLIDQPCPLLVRGSRRPLPARSRSESARPTPRGYRNEGEASPSYHEINDRFDNSNSTNSGGSSHLRDQILELSNRMRCLETRLLQSNPSCSPPRGRARDDGEVDRGGGCGGGGGSGYRIGSQDDLAYRSVERHKRTSDLSKRSWPPATASSRATIPAAGRRVGTHPMSNTGSNSSSGSCSGGSTLSESSLVFATRELTAVSSHPRRWERGEAAAGGRGSGGGGGGGGDGSGHPAGGRGSRRVGRRKAGGTSRGKKSNGNPPGIVLI